MKSALILILITLLCTCGRAQLITQKLPRVVSNIAFIKGETGFLIDSLTIRTTLDTVPYGFAFPNDSLFLDISIYDPVDELILETFARGHAFGRSRCWVDAPTADIYLSIKAGRSAIDSVGLSPVERTFWKAITSIKAEKKPQGLKQSVLSAMDYFIDSPIAADFLATYMDMPNLSREDVKALGLNLNSEALGRVRRHPRFKAPLRKFKLMNSNLPGKLSKYELRDANGEVKETTSPETDYWVLNIYSTTNPDARREHILIRNTMETDSLFNGFPVISVSADVNAEDWSAYLQEGNFPWPHYREAPTGKAGLTVKAGLYPGSTYLLLNEKNKIEGVYDDVGKLAAAILYRKRPSTL